MFLFLASVCFDCWYITTSTRALATRYSFHGLHIFGWKKTRKEKGKKKRKRGIFSLSSPLHRLSWNWSNYARTVTPASVVRGASCQTVEEGREREIPISRDSRLFSSFGRVIYSTKKLNRLSSLSRSISSQTCVRRTRTEHRQPTWTQRATLPILFYILNVNEYEVCKVNRWKN